MPSMHTRTHGISAVPTLNDDRPRRLVRFCLAMMYSQGMHLPYSEPRRVVTYVLRINAGESILITSDRPQLVFDMWKTTNMGTTGVDALLRCLP